MDARLALLLAAAAMPALAQSVSAQSEPKPFPVDKTIDLKEPGQVYTVEGRQVIKSNVKITCLRNCIIRGVGEGATLVVEGPLKMKAVTGGRVRFENVWVEITPECKELTLSDVEWWGGGGLRTDPEAPSRAKMFLIAVYFYRSTYCEITASDGKVELQNCHFDEPLQIDGAPRSEKSGSNAVFQLEACQGEENGRPRGILGGLKASGGKSLLVRNCDLAGVETSFRDCPKLEFDGNNARSKTTAFAQSEFGAFGGTRISNCDFRTQLVFRAPPDERSPDKAERVMLDHSWFGGLTEDEDVARTMIADQRKDAGIAVLCTFAKISPVPLRLAGSFESG